MPYEPYQNVYSGLTEPFIRGLLPLDESGASVIAYRKDLTVSVFLNLFGDTVYRDLTGSWQVRIRESDARGENGEYVAPILFEQTVTWTARVIALNIGGIYLVTWTPNGNQQTSIVNGEACATIANINAATSEEMEAYGKTGAWRFLDTGINWGNMTPEQKYAAENGFTIFKDEGAATVGGYHFFATWQCRFYRCDVPPGAILETVFDHWQNAGLTEAHYKVSWKKGTPDNEGTLYDENGQRFWTRIIDGPDVGKQTVVYRSRRGLSPLPLGVAEYTGAIDDVALGGVKLSLLSGGAMLCIGANQTKIKAYISTDRAKTWTKIMDEIGNITILASCLSHDAASFSIYGKNGDGKARYLILRHEKDGWRVAESGEPAGERLPLKGVSSLNLGEGGVMRMMVRDAERAELRVLVSTDGGRSYRDELVRGEEKSLEEQDNV